MIEANSGNLEANVPAFYRLSYRDLKFEARLGSGSFGDCFKARKGERPVAVKRMRVGLVDQAGLEAFTKEVTMLCSVDHINIVSLVGYWWVSSQGMRATRDPLPTLAKRDIQLTAAHTQLFHFAANRRSSSL